MRHTFICSIPAVVWLIMVEVEYPSDLPDMYTQAQGPLGPRAWVYISGKSRGHVIQLICTMHPAGDLLPKPIQDDDY